MAFQAAGAMIEMCILALLKEEDLYGYKLTRAIADPLGLSESTLYPVLRRLKKEGYLDVYDRNFDGRNRRYYTLTSSGIEYEKKLIAEWDQFTGEINKLIHRQTPVESEDETEKGTTI